ncbi:glycosyltransferase family 2 protein [Terribacillus halophilus]|uniref:glycosyltransferase family 2 protein n=1 Tax=Terribacillus halophilus TaxID=361279 RepID=UPI000985093B|nr:glycosyltransferase family 2 protein [Terribacillus halophilus]
MSHNISYIFVIYNDYKLLEKSLPSVLKQEDVESEIIIVDNAPSLESQKIIHRLIRTYTEGTILYFPQEHNLGYSGGANYGINAAQHENVCILNADIYLTSSYSYRILSELNKSENRVGATGKILKYDFENDCQTRLIDTTGIHLEKNFKAFDRGQGEIDQGQYDEEKEIFGICGAIAIYKKEILKIAAYENEYFDEDFLAYKEDVDLSWRLTNLDYSFIYVPEAIGFHGRGMEKISGHGIYNMIKRRKRQSAFLRELSLSNQRLMIMKNIKSKHLYENWFSIAIRMVLEAGFSILVEPKVYIKSWIRTIKLRKAILRKRKALYSGMIT